MDKQEMDSNDGIVQKPLPLMRLWKSPLTLSEFKIFDMYLSRIDPQHPENRKVHFSKSEIESVLGVKRIRREDLERHVQHLAIPMEIDELDESGRFRSLVLLEDAACCMDNDGLLQVELACTPQAAEYIFNIENRECLRYSLQSVTGIRSRYSYLLFMYVERNRSMGSWEVDVDELREHLGCDTEFYRSYKEFKRHILTPCQEELAGLPACRFTWEPIRRGRRVRWIRFSVESATPSVAHDANTAQTLPDSSGIEEGNQSLKEYLECLKRLEHLIFVCALDGSDQPEFSGADAQHILAVLAQVPLRRMPELEEFGGAPYLRRAVYLAGRYTAMNRAAQNTPIRDRAGYLISLMKQDVEYER